MEWLDRIRTELSERLAGLEPAVLDAGAVRALLEGFVALGKLADAGAVVCAHAVVATDPRGVGAATGELARGVGVSRADAERMVATSKALPMLERTRAALVAGSLSRTQAGLVAEAASESPGSEAGLLDTATSGDLVGLRREVERVKAACGDEGSRRRRAHADRSWSTWVRNGEWHLHAHGPVVEGAEIELAHRPFRDAALEEARKTGMTEPFGASGFDGLVAMARAATGGGGLVSADGKTVKKRRWQAVIRADASAIRRGSTVDGEVCEIPGVGPVDVERAIDLLGQATVRVLVKDGQDVLSIARVDRYRPPNLDVALLEKADFTCANAGCSNAGWLEVDHDDDYARSHDTSYRNLNCFCGRCHDLKTHHGWKVTRRPDGQIKLIPPDDPDPP